jgi:sugar phosphate isomerase/epimerase
MGTLKLACCNFIPDPQLLRTFALEHGFQGIDWTFTLENLPRTPGEESSLVQSVSHLQPLEVRYHCALEKTDLGDENMEARRDALRVFRHVCRLVSKLGGRYLTIHVGLGRNSTSRISWDSTIETMAAVVRFANRLGVRLCLENLAWGWTSRPELYEKLIRKSGSWATLDIGHARVSPSVASHYYEVRDFVAPHPERILNAHVYHEERDDVHLPAERLEDLEDRLPLLTPLPLCDWWVLELRETEALLATLRLVREFLDTHQERHSRASRTLRPA